MQHGLGLMRSRSSDSWCTTRTQIHTPQDESPGASQSRTHVFRSTSQELSSAFIDAKESLSAREDDEESSNEDELIRSESSSTLGSLSAPPIRSFAAGKAIANMRTANNARRSQSPSLPSDAALMHYNASPLPTSRTARTSTTSPRPSMGSPRPSIDPFHDWSALGLRSASRDNDTTPTVPGLWGSGWNNMAAWSPAAQPIEEGPSRGTTSMDSGRATILSRASTALSRRPSAQSRRVSRAGHVSPAPANTSTLTTPTPIPVQSAPVATSPWRSLLRHSKSAINVRASQQHQQQRHEQRQMGHPTSLALDSPSAPPPSPLMAKRRRFDSTAGKIMSKLFRRRNVRKEKAENGPDAGDLAEEPRQYEGVPSSTGAPRASIPSPRSVRTRDLSDPVEVLQPSSSPRTSTTMPRSVATAKRPSPVLPDPGRLSVEWSRRPSLASIYPRSILTSPTLDATDDGELQPPRSVTPVPPSPVTSRHVSFEVGRPSLSLSADAAQRRSCSAGRVRKEHVSGRNSSASLSTTSLRKRRTSYRSSASSDRPRSELSYESTTGTSITTAASSAAAASTSQIFEQGPKPFARSLDTWEASADHDNKPLAAMGGNLKEAVQKATRSWSSLAFHAEHLECEGTDGEPVIAVRGRKSSSGGSSIWCSSTAASGGDSEGASRAFHRRSVR